ncbi:MAG TPA: MBL fold metallo-hydrolase [Vicinamibacterales bacterium]|nr:MBL fold metallo-hydrolase [Vicinamibacterales bacterium]
MNRRLLLAASLVALLAAQSAWVISSQSASAQATQSAKPPGALKAQRVQGDLHMISGEGGNVAVYVTPDGVVLVDDMFDRNHADILAQVKQITDRPLRYVINTHQHDDHAGGDFKMLPLAEVIAHRNVYANLKNLKRPYFEDTPGTPIGLPRVTFSDRLDVHLSGKDVEAYYFGRGHTSGDIIVYFPEYKAIHTGDLFISGSRRGVPIYVDAVQGGSLLEWTRTLERTLQLDFDIVIPGHGPVATKADLARFNADIAAMRTRLQSMIKGGASRDAVVQVVEKEYGWRATGCPPAPQMTPGCLQYQQIDSLIAELR